MRDEYRILQGGMVVAGSNSLADILHYAMVYGRDGPVVIEERRKGRWRKLDVTARAIEARQQ